MQYYHDGHRYLIPSTCHNFPFSNTFKELLKMWQYWLKPAVVTSIIVEYEFFRISIV